MKTNWRHYARQLRDIVKRVLETDPWTVHITSLSWARRQLVLGHRIIRLIAGGFRNDNCPLHAAALTYTTLLALIPIMAVGTWILRGVGAADVAQRRVMSAIQAMPPEFQSFMSDIIEYVAETDFAAMGGIGLVLLLWMAIAVLSRVEASFNKIWAVGVNRSFLRKTADYISILVIVPILFVAATTINTAMASEFLAVFFEERLGMSTALFRRTLSLTPWVGAGLALTFMNIYLPNTRVRFFPGLIGGLIGGSLWILWQILYLHFQFGIAKYNAVYGTFASIPIFLAWVYISWQIVLLSAEISFSIQHRNTYRGSQENTGIGVRSRFLLMLAILSRTAENQFSHGSVFDGASFAEAEAVPARAVNETVTHLTRTGYLVEVAEPRGAVVLLHSPKEILLRDVAATAMFLDKEKEFPATKNLPTEFQQVWQQMEAGLTQKMGGSTLHDFIVRKGKP